MPTHRHVHQHLKVSWAFILNLLFGMFPARGMMLFVSQTPVTMTTIFLRNWQSHWNYPPKIKYGNFLQVMVLVLSKAFCIFVYVVSKLKKKPLDLIWFLFVFGIKGISRPRILIHSFTYVFLYKMRPYVIDW